MSLSEQDQKLIRSAIDGNLSEVRDLLLAGANVTAGRENDGATTALLASQNGRVEVVRELLQNSKVDANLKDNDGLSAFDVARHHTTIAVGQGLDDQSKTLKDVNENWESLAEAMTTTSMADPVELSFQYVKRCITNRKLGPGAFGDVVLAEDCRLPKKFLVQGIKLSERSDGPNDENLKTFKKELSTLKRFHHPNILDLYGYNFNGSAGEQFLVYEYAANGTLDGLLKDDNRRAILPAATRLLIMYELARAVHFLHTGGAGFKVFHGDIKSANIYLTEDFTPRLIDCGLAKFVEDKRNAIPSETTQQTRGPAIGTSWYMCPEYTSKKAYQIECDYIPAHDVYSLGVVMAELILGRLNDDNPTNIFETYVMNGKSPIVDGWKLLKNDADVLVDWNADTLELVCKTAVGCITPSSEGRLSTSELLPRLHRAIVLNAGRSGVVLGGDIDDDVTAMLSPIKFGEMDSAITFNAGDDYVVPGEALNNLVNNLSLINDGQSCAVRELADDLMVSARSMNSGEGSSDPDGAGHGVPCSACNRRPFVVKCEGESHSLCALCIDIAVLKGPKGAVDDLELPCPMGHCSSRPFTEGDLYKHVHGNAWNCLWLKNNRLRVAENQSRAENVGVRY